MPLGMEVNHDSGDLVLDGDPAPPPPKGGGAPKFSDHVYCGQMAGCIKMALGMEVGFSPVVFVLPLPKKAGARPQFSAYAYCGQTAAWIKMPLGTEVGLGSDDIVLDGDPAPTPHKGGRAPPPIFGPLLLWPNGWMH